MKVSEAIDQLEIGDTVWVKGKVSDTDKSDQPLYVCIGGTGYKWLGNRAEISLTEPQAEKVVVPEFVAEWYESNKHKLERAIIDVACSMEKGEFPYNLPFEDWFIDPETHPIETLICMKDGYTVEKPKRWVVRAGDYHSTYVDSLTITSEKSRHTISGKEKAHYFTDRKKAEAVATLVEGSVEEA